MSKLRLPVIVSMGGINAAGRSSGHHAYRRMVFDKLDSSMQYDTLSSLASMCGLELTESFSVEQQQDVLSRTLIRQVEQNHFDVENLSWMTPLDTHDRAGKAMEFECRRKQLPRDLPPNWVVQDLADDRVSVRMEGQGRLFVPNTRIAPVQSAGQLPTGFDPANLYPSRFHPRGLQMSVVAASDALNNMGLAWESLCAALPADQIAVYSGSVMAQLDDNGYGGLLQSRMKGGRVSSKQLPLGLNTMPADFVNAYVLGSLGATGSVTGACATFLYNLRMGVEDIQSGRRRVVFVGNAEAPLTSEVFEGYGAMSALATDEGLRKLDGSDKADHRRASRPFGENCGFTLAESAQYIVLMDDELAIEMGAEIYGAVSDVFINADGYKKSISAPGPGNYITLAKSMAASAALLGESSVRDRSYIQAHGSSTPQNRVTESRILDKMARNFGINSWPVSAVKAYVGHSLAPASADQMMAVLGQFAHGWLPGLKTSGAIADDVYQDNLNFPLDDIELPDRDVAFINSKGFGGNNATAAVVHPAKVEEMLSKRYDKETMNTYQAKLEQTREQRAQYEASVSKGDWQVRYRFGEGMIEESDLDLQRDSLRIPGWDKVIELPSSTPYDDLSLS
ncbi:beta-ketoacyl synthase [uncultured Pseudoteredinibacter sp.]|uniref:beta-ketoacyl synthase n=1 Tax=uncultured Pseudoteredinibacter sp. TaxID=1641701 RepID=UPI00262ADCCB|nr:beta-ketoacyl synthase [uncultured Pseudoteredinibacter sp.]